MLFICFKYLLTFYICFIIIWLRKCFKFYFYIMHWIFILCILGFGLIFIVNFSLKEYLFNIHLKCRMIDLLFVQCFNIPKKQKIKFALHIWKECNLFSPGAKKEELCYHQADKAAKARLKKRDLWAHGMVETKSKWKHNR